MESGSCSMMMHDDDDQNNNNNNNKVRIKATMSRNREIQECRRLLVHLGTQIRSNNSVAGGTSSAGTYNTTTTTTTTSRKELGAMYTYWRSKLGSLEKDHARDWLLGLLRRYLLADIQIELEPWAHCRILDYMKRFGFGKDRDVLLAVLTLYSRRHCSIPPMFPRVCADSVLPVMDEAFLDDAAIMTEACKLSSAEFQRASARLRDDKDFVMTVLQVSSTTRLVYASDRIKGDKTFILQAITNKCPRCLEHASDELRNDREIAEVVLELDDCQRRVAFEHLSVELRSDKGLMMQFVAKDGLLLRHIPAELHRDDDIVRAACSNSPWAIQHYVSNTLTKDLNFMLDLVKQISLIVNYYEGDGRLDNKDLVLELVKENAAFLKFASPRLQENRDVLLACKRDMMSPISIPQVLLEDRDSLMKVLEKGLSGVRLFQIPRRLCEDRTFILKACDEYPEATYESLPDDITESDLVVMRTTLHALARKGQALFPTLVSCMEKHDFAPLRNDRELLLSLLKNYKHDESGTVQQFVGRLPSEFYDDKDFMVLACSKCPYGCIEYASRRLRGDRDFIATVGTVKDWWGYKVLSVTSREFQLANQDIVINVINGAGEDYDVDGLYDTIKIWDKREVVDAWLQKGWSLLDRWPRNLYLDPALFLVAIQNDFQEIPTIDDKVWIEAIASHPGTIAACGCSRDDSQNDFISLCRVATKVRKKLERFDIFVRLILCGIGIRRHNVPPSRRCPLPYLDRGVETTISLKKSIAAFCGVPVGRELKILRKASKHLYEMGF